MSFTRVTGSVALSPTPVMVFGAFEVEREVRNVAQELLHSSTTRSSFIPATNRKGSWKLLYASHANAKTAMDFFTVASFYTYDVADASLDTRFIVHGGNLSITQNGTYWELTIPYREIPA
jgi:hypothetical protein